MLKRIAACALTLALTAVVLVGPALSQAAGKVAMLLPGSINDQSWNASGYAGLQKLKAGGMEIAYSENVAAADQVEAMKDYARRGFNPIIGHSGRYFSPAQRVAPEFKSTLFLVGAGNAGFGDNVAAIDYASEQFGYLLGVLGARMTKTNKIGAVAGLEGLPNMVALNGGFRLGAKSVKPDVEVKVMYLQSMEDPAAAKEAALALIAGGADFISGRLNAGHAGLVQAAKEKGVWVTGRSYGHTAIAPDRVITNVLENWPDMYVAAMKEMKAGKLGGRFIQYGFHTVSAAGTSGSELRQSTERAFHAAVPAPLIADLLAVQKKIGTGEIKIAPTKEDARGGV